ncbi:hypothetical protein PoB_007521900 [Plakobranchus ocellatus]|uniref:Uncharacterized protein n=1 Tax=Plakobranchus ocellatus TaxID=259542 RepID=A0AAV4DWX4_9GAST|nr:hypothetical protein PoB_007521900 [Plakobranchus ocellatus]
MPNLTRKTEGLNISRKKGRKMSPHHKIKKSLISIPAPQDEEPIPRTSASQVRAPELVLQHYKIKSFTLQYHKEKQRNQMLCLIEEQTAESENIENTCSENESV